LEKILDANDERELQELADYLVELVRKSKAKLVN